MHALAKAREKRWEGNLRGRKYRGRREQQIDRSNVIFTFDRKDDNPLILSLIVKIYYKQWHCNYRTINFPNIYLLKHKFGN
ncbi:hypothetical protein HMPREF3293_03033 [Christensenella minuta]|uniref:Uncharacterized protein n=1 Tax=Christensenella minuta TaxID=626937 RepID=A0A136Q173_9FIRM|nr:hypothetical protein HMPREF3293_03033 [Christensenella minuta]